MFFFNHREKEFYTESTEVGVSDFGLFVNRKGREGTQRLIAQRFLFLTTENTEFYTENTKVGVSDSLSSDFGLFINRKGREGTQRLIAQRSPRIPL